MSDNGSLPLPNTGTSDQSAPASPAPGVHNLERSVCAFDSFEYEADGNTFHATYDGDAVVASIAVVSALAVVTDTAPVAVDPLQSAVDADALNALVARDGGGDVSVRFAIAGHDVTVEADGALSVQLPAGSEPSHDTDA